MKYLKWLISAALLAVLAWFTDWDQVRASFARLRPDLWLAALGLFLLTQLVSGQRWRLLARPLGFTQSARQFTAYVFIGMFTNLLLPTSVGGDVVKALYLDAGSRRKVPALLSVFVDRLTGLLVLLLLACVAVLLCPLVLPARIHLGRPRLMLAATALALVVQAANVAVVWLIGRSVDAPVPGTFYWILVPMVSLLVMVPVSVNGMGVREWALAAFLAPLGVAGGTAVSLAWLWFAVSTCAGLVGGLVYLCGPFPRPERQAEHGSVGDHPDQGRAGQPRAAA
jgi:glycosyltransferase 2 family protein